MKISEYLSLKIKILSFVAIMMVLYIHTYIPEGSQHRLFFIFENFWGNYFFRVFAPLFFSISGFLFYLNVDGFTIEIWKKKLIGRFHSLVIPYIFWNLFFIALMLLLILNPLTSKFINSDYSFLKDYNLFQLFNYLFIEPVGFHLWFIRDLIAIICLTPLLYFLIKKSAVIWIFTLIIASYFELPLALSLFHFSIGAMCAIKKINAEHTISLTKTILLFILTITIGLYIAVNNIYNNYTFYFAWITFFALWFGYDHLVTKENIFINMKKLTAYTFFIYVSHEPLLNIFKKIILRIGNNQEWSLWMCYLLTPLFTLVFVVFIAKCLQRVTPGFYRVITGGR